MDAALDGFYLASTSIWFRDKSYTNMARLSLQKMIIISIGRNNI